MKRITDKDIKRVDKLLFEMEYYAPAERTVLLLAVVQSMAIELEDSNSKDSVNLAASLGLQYLGLEFKKKMKNLTNLVRLLVAVGGDFTETDMFSKLEKDVLAYIVERREEILSTEKYYLRQNSQYGYLFMHLKTL